jgi:hypothetical protein
MTIEIAIIVGCLPPFRAIISTQPNTNQPPYGSSRATPNSYDRNHSARGKHRSDAASWSEPPFPLHDLGPYQNNLDYRTCVQDVYISGGQILPNNVLRCASEEAVMGDIIMVQEFVSSALLYIFYYEELTTVCSQSVVSSR